MGGMTSTDSDLLSEIEKTLKEKYEKKETGHRLPSNAAAAAGSDRVVSLLLPDNERPKMPLTKDKYVVRENPHKVAWEREVRKFCRNLTLTNEHRISASMIYEWATGIKVADYIASEGAAPPDLRTINWCLRFYFGKPYSTYIAGRKVPNCYKVKVGYRMKRHVPQTMTLKVEYYDGVLEV